MTRIAVLRVFAKWWVAFSIILVAIGALGIALQDGMGRMVEIFSPFNVFNTLAIVLLVSPAIVASKWATRLEMSVPLDDDEAQRLVNAYGGVLMRRSGLERLSPDALPAPKARMKDAIKHAASRISDGPERGTLGVGYVLLADFQRSGVSNETQLVEMAALAAEWKAFSDSIAVEANE